MLLRHRYKLDEPPTSGLTQQIPGIDMRASQRNCKVMVYHLVEGEEYRRVELAASCGREAVREGGHEATRRS